MTAPAYTIRRAGVDDLEPILELRREASVWLAGRGIDQWTWDMTALIRGRLEDGHMWVLDDDQAGAVIATITLKGPDLDFWTNADDLDAGLHFYKLIVRRTHAGRGIGDRLMDWAGDRAGREGRRWLRCDCDRRNTRLHAYYVSRGFELVRVVERPDRQSGALFQRPTRLLAEPAFREINGGDE